MTRVMLAGRNGWDGTNRHIVVNWTKTVFEWEL